LQDLVNEIQQQLFIGVDEYDAPANSLLFSKDVMHRARYEILANLFETRFFSVIKGALGKPIVKYWVTGVLPAFRDVFSPLHANTIVSRFPRFNGVCGLTEDEVEAVANEYLQRSHSPEEIAAVLRELKLWYNGYMFSHSEDKSASSALYNPQQVFTHLRNVHDGSGNVGVLHPP
jgi:hypothetical protein